MKNILRHWILALVHVLLILFLVVSPWFIPWQYILVIFMLYRLQLIVFNGCVLTQLQFGLHNDGFYYHYIKKFYPKIQHTTIDIVVDTILPLLIITFAYILQIYL